MDVDIVVIHGKGPKGEPLVSPVKKYDISDNH